MPTTSTARSISALAPFDETITRERPADSPLHTPRSSPSVRPQA